jgi:hypothetical protein
MSQLSNSTIRQPVDPHNAYGHRKRRNDADRYLLCDLVDPCHSDRVLPGVSVPRVSRLASRTVVRWREWTSTEPKRVV